MSNGCNENTQETHDHKVTIFEVNDKPKVINGYLVSKKGKKVKFAAANVDAIIFFPDPLIFEEGTNVQVVYLFKKEKDKNSKILKLKDDCKGGVYPYAIYCKETNDFVEVDSPPTMIIEEDPP